MALTKIDAERAKRTVSKNIDRVKQGKKPLRSGQRARVRKKKAKAVYKDAVEAEEVKTRADKMIGADGWGLRNIVNVKVLYLFVHSEKVAGGCIDGIIKATRYPRIHRWRTGLKYEILVVLAKPRWDRASDEEKSRFLFHGLRHFWTDSDGSLRMAQHEIAGFFAEVERFGLKSPEIAKIAEQLDLLGQRELKPQEKGGN